MNVRQRLDVGTALQVAIGIGFGVGLGVFLQSDGVALPVLGRTSQHLVGGSVLVATGVAYSLLPASSSGCGCSGDCGC